MLRVNPIHLAVFSALLSISSSSVGAEPACKTTNPTTSQVPVPWQNKLDPGARSIWFGSESLAVLVPRDGVWGGSGRENDYGNKLWFWSEDWSLQEEPQPALKVYARELNDEKLRSESASTTHGYGPGWEAMLTGLGFPAPGCWEISSFYRASKVTFVVKVLDR